MSNEDTVRETTAKMKELQAEVERLSQIRRKAIGEMVDAGAGPTAIAQAMGTPSKGLAAIHIDHYKKSKKAREK